MTKKTETKEKLVLKAKKRKVFGRKVKKLRREGILPANIFGAKIKSLAIQVPLKEFSKVYQKAGETGIINLEVEGEAKPRSVLIHDIHIDPVDSSYLHCDFRQVVLTEKITANIPIELTGEAPAESQKLGVLVHMLQEVEVEALPTNLPEKFIVDISGLTEVDQTITVADLKTPEGVKIINPPGQIIVKIEPPSKEEVAPPPAEEEAPAEEKPAAEEKPSGEEKPTAEESKPEEKDGGEEKPESK